jgi:hypothetical protein
VSALDRNYLIVLYILSNYDLRIDIHTLIDYGCTGYSFMNDEFTRQHNFPCYQLKTPKTIEVIHRWPISSGDITKYIYIDCTISNYHEKLVTYVASISHYPLILRILWLKKHDVSINFPKMDIQFPLPNCLTHQSKITLTPIKGITMLQNNKIYAISATLFCQIVNNMNNHYGKVEQFTLSLYEINTTLAKEDDKKPNIRTIVLPKYHNYLKIFENTNANKLPLHCPSEHTILLMDMFKPLFGPLYSLSYPELEELKCWLHENLSKGFICTLSSPADAPILFVKKGDGSFWLVIDYRGINKGTIKNGYPLPLLQDTLMNLLKAKWFMKLDICRAYNLIHMAEGEEWKTAFCTSYGLFKSLVMPFGLTNTPVIFQNYINNILLPYLDYFCTTYLDDTSIYSDNFEEHQQYIRFILDAFTKVGLHLKPKKCDFHQQEVKYLGLIISMEGIKIDPKKIYTR